MPSQAFTNYLDVLLRDAEDIQDAHTELRTGNAGRQWGLGGLNRASVVMCVSAWEAYVEELTKESLEKMRPAAPPLGNWPALNASARSEIGSFNNPNPEKVRMLFANCIGLQNITVSWHWQGCAVAEAVNHLQQALSYRHQIAHGVNPRPVVHNYYSRWLPGFFRRLGRKTDDAVKDYLMQTLALPIPWL
jgi:hypothetical protein